MNHKVTDREIDQEKVSIIVPVYNAEKYIEACVESLLEQTYTNLEIILVDDGSLDRTEEIIASAYGSHPQIVYIKKQNEGASAARNTGLKLASGGYITFVDADDWVSCDFIENALQFIKEYGLDIVLGGTVKVYPDHQTEYCADGGKPIWVYDDLIPIRRRVLSNGAGVLPELSRCFTSGAVCKVFRREVLEQVEFDTSLAIGEDTVFNLAAMEHAGRMGVTGQCWYYYRIYHGSATMQRRGNIEKETEALLRILYEQYGSQAEYRSCLAVRAVQQFHGMLLAGVLHKDSVLSFAEKRTYIRRCLRKSPWKEVFASAKAGELPANRFDKLLFLFCRRNWGWGILLLIRMRLWGKALIGGIVEKRQGKSG